MKAGTIPIYLCVSAPRAGLAQSGFNKHERNKGMSSKDALPFIHVRALELIGSLLSLPWLSALPI